MRLFTTDLFRQFAFGFVMGAGALALLGSDKNSLQAELVSPAIAAEIAPVVTPSEEFRIAADSE